ncbi:methyltransferase domain-containing protein [Leptolyngbya cf. ectocarpi LEGE 11479]|uniref:Methyltransferase domain-containing protein n=1 Tax=Leptolyngbya cf. ectocarpi LEGE 11479 TaxID=1828722 RepID=A0A928ZS50_LEPEC|nr:methyltransferase domain-containing protein [Leptolyngbya ectocarpi]MBE9065622.1 methyltransferase domain-containing protein [Leptolyngbya cf. ectocarpi LEGE 11479]
MDFDPVRNEYSRLAPFYDRRWSSYIDSTIQATISRLTINPHEHVLDLGCGTGTLIQQLMHLTPTAIFYGLDTSVEMLNVAKQKLPNSVELWLGSADELPFPDESFDVVVSTNAFHYLRNPSQVIQEVKRVLTPEGRLVITDWCHDYWTCRICDFFLRLFNRAHFRTYGASECQMILQEEGLQEVFIEKYKIDWHWGMMTAQAVNCQKIV